MKLKFFLLLFLKVMLFNVATAQNGFVLQKVDSSKEIDFKVNQYVTIIYMDSIKAPDGSVKKKPVKRRMVQGRLINADSEGIVIDKALSKKTVIVDEGSILKIRRDYIGVQIASGIFVAGSMPIFTNSIIIFGSSSLFVIVGNRLAFPFKNIEKSKWTKNNRWMVVINQPVSETISIDE